MNSMMMHISNERLIYRLMFANERYYRSHCFLVYINIIC